MTPAAIIRDASADGVRLTLSPSGTIKATGDGAAVRRWLATIREHKTTIIAHLRTAAKDEGGDTASDQQPPAPMTAGEETAVRAWLEWIGESDAAIIADVLGRCAGDLSARAYFIDRAGEIRQPAGPAGNGGRT